ncbi:DUF4440 domain-containing protein [Ahniella affigens]|uniref:DUF4440 domain-containing protein n=1 Tax=Ahniella affigens TaxID=2021234 RepID=A0A2P1PTX5_9GAMM|nr:DUF4440 domain-containing protein [Ahniella affigens]AVP98293.1 DUF4440 domain-containing protein [Ahniella affigens]
MTDATRASQSEIDALIAAFYQLFDNRHGVARGLLSATDLMTADVSIRRRLAGGWELMDLPQFLTPRIELLRTRLNDFHEWETSAETLILGDQAVRTSRYAKTGLLDGAPYGGSGSKCFMLIRLAAGWRIAGVTWIDD